MYKIATAHSYSLDHGVPMIAHRVHEVPSYGQPRATYWNSMFHKVNLQNVTQNMQCIKETQLSQRITHASYLDDYCQNVDFFHHHYESICDLFTLPLEMEQRVRDLYRNVLDQYNENTVSVHVRKEDDSTHNGVAWYREVMPMQFFINAMDQCGEDTTFVVLSNNVDYCKRHFGKYKNVYYPQQEDYIELKLMSKCRDHIMPFSTFSWWGVYLNQRQEKKIYVPSIDSIQSNDFGQKEYDCDFYKTRLQLFRNVIPIVF